MASLILQIALGFALGHAYDDRINLATGYLVATGQNPYTAQDLTGVIQHPGFQEISSVGYPPPWPLLLGLIYLLSYKIIPNFLLYNLAVKIPIILANLFLALAVRRILVRLGADHHRVRWAWIFMLFNPFLLLATSAWGQIDSTAALLAILAFGNLVDGKRTESAALLALALAFKPIVLPLLPAIWIYLKQDPIRMRMQYLGEVIMVAGALCILPFFLPGWDASIILANWNAHVLAGGGLSFLSILNLISGSTRLQGGWQVLGFLWLPALIIATVVFHPPGKGWIPLLKVSAVMMLVFFIFRSWVSEPNIVLVLPMILILTVLGNLTRTSLRAAWILPLVFSFFNMALVQLLFPIAPALMDRWMRGLGLFGAVWQILAALTALAWLVFAGRTILVLIKVPRLKGIPDAN